jgi:hypothetical protein
VNPFPEEVYDRASAARFVKWCVDVIGLGYHPDTPFADYVDGDGRATFSSPEAGRLEELADRVFKFCDPFEVGHDAFQQLVGVGTGGHQTG